MVVLFFILFLLIAMLIWSARQAVVEQQRWKKFETHLDRLVKGWGKHDKKS
jgi:hypothetical protein